MEKSRSSGNIGRRGFLRGSLAAAASLRLTGAELLSAGVLPASGQTAPHTSVVNPVAKRPPEYLGERDRLLAPYASSIF